MSLASALHAGRRAAERLMSDTVTISYPDPSGATTQDPDTGTTTPVMLTRFTSKCKVQARNLAVQDAEVGGRTAEIIRAELHLPVDAPAVQPGDVAEITAVGALSDVTLLGRKFTIQGGTPPKSHATARRLEVEEVVS